MKTKPVYSVITIVSTASLAISFYVIDISFYKYWLLTALPLTVVLFFLRPDEGEEESDAMYHPGARKWLLPANRLVRQGQHTNHQ